MWNCNWGQPFTHGGWFMGHGPFGPLLGILLVALFVYLVVLAIRAVTTGKKTNRDAGDSLEIIKTKYASGEITEEEYRRMKEVLLQ